MKITISEINNNPHLPFDHDMLDLNENIKPRQEKITFDKVLNHLDKNWNWYNIIPDFKDVLENPTLPWNWMALSEHLDINLDTVSKYLYLPWDWKLLSKNKHITWEDIINHPDLPINFSWLSLNPSITIDNIRKNLDKPWNWIHICENTFDSAYNKMIK
jgi:hypothetical protein